jgi:GNAT superfamily N-acetyltransferase
MREVVRFGPEMCGEFLALHGQANGAGWCRCVAWWASTWEGWGSRTAEENQALRERLWAEGDVGYYLLRADGQPAGSCQVGPRDRLEKLVRQYALPPDPGTWAISCFLIAPVHRRRGHAAFLLAEVLADLARRGVRRVEAYPRRGEGLDESDLWTGPEAMYLRAGFTVIRDHPTRPVLGSDPFSAPGKGV